jgi:hypothetical protein
VLVFAALVGLWQAVYWLGWLDYAATYYDQSGVKMTLYHLRPIRAALADQRDVVVISDGVEVLYDVEPARWLALLGGPGRCVRTVGGDGTFVAPGGEAFAALFAPNAVADPAYAVYQDAAPRRYPLREGEGAYTLYARIRESAPRPPLPPLSTINPVRFGSGAALIGYRLEAEPGFLALAWQLPAARDEDYHIFAHFLDAQGEKIGQRDRFLWPGRFWCAGDTLYTWTAANVPDGVRTLRVGLYRFVSGGTVRDTVRDSEGRPFSDYVDLPIEPVASGQ